MKITAIKTKKILPKKQSLNDILNKYLPSLKEKSIVVITSKIVAICEGRVIKMDKIDKEKLISQESSFYLPPNPSMSRHKITLTIKNNLLVATAGIDESNGNGYYILWPKNPQKSANQIRKFLKKRFSLKNIGVLITDSKTIPLRRGTIGMAIAHSGFAALKNYIGKPDIFGRELKVTKVNIIDGLAAGAVALMGEGSEQTPIALIEDVPFVDFQDRNPTREEINNLKINIDEDLYAPLLKGVNWIKGESKS